MSVSVDTLIEMLAEIESADPIDFGDLPFGEPELRRLVMYSLVERHNEQHAAMTVDEMLAMYLLSTAKLVIENTVLHAKLLLLQGRPVDVNALLSSFTLKGKPAGA